MSMEFSFSALPENLHSLLDSRASSCPDRVYVTLEGRSLTYGSVSTLSRCIAGWLAAFSVKPGERVLLMMEASEIHLGLWFAISRLGTTEVPINPAYKGALLRQLVETAAPSLCIIDEKFLHEFKSACGDLIPERLIRVTSDVAGCAGCECSVVPTVSPRSASAIIFTSGTTGRSKGVMMAHSQQLSFGAAFKEIAGLQEDDVVYNFLPFFHIAAKFVALGAMLAGGRMVLRNGFSVSNFWPDVRAHGVTVCAAVGGLCHMLNSQPKRDDDVDNPLRLIYAVPIPWEFKAEFESRFGLELIEGYGGTECNLVAYSRPREPTPRGACGRASPHFELQIQGETGNAVPPGEPGEICIRPKHPGTMMLGYLGMPEKTLEIMTDYWFHTGDRGFFDGDGYLFFLDRMKDAIRRRGENISSFEVERILNGFDAVAESAVIPVPSEVGEEEVKAFVVLKVPGSVSEEAVFRYAMDNMPYFMVPRFVEFRTQLPRTPTLKVKKADLRAEGNSKVTWDCEKAGMRISRHGLTRREQPRPQRD